MTVINQILMKGRHVIIPEILKTQALQQLHVGHMGIENAKLLAYKSVYEVNINDDIKNNI